MITHDELLRLLHYDPLTGVFTRLVGTSGRFGKIGNSVGGLSERGYIRINISGHKYMAHTLAWFYTHKEWAKEIDHKNRVRHDNRLCNIRPVTRSQNKFNSLPYKNNSSGFRGVTFRKERGDWQAYASINHQRFHLGFFSTPEAAARAYDEKVRGEVGAYAVFNFENDV